jgi:thiol-disulfide isomerase/thioredoxin
MRLAALVVGISWFFLSVAGAHAESQASSSNLRAISSLPDLLKAVAETKARVILLNVWAPGCSHCMVEMPALVRVAKTVFKGNSDLALLGLSLAPEGAKKDAALEKAQAIVKKKELPYTNLVWLGSGEVLQEKLGIQATPTNLLLSPDGKLLGEIAVPTDPDKAEAELSKFLREVLQKLKAGESGAAGAAK